MSDMAWLVLAMAVGALVVTAWVARERWIHRRRRRQLERGEMER